MKKLEIETKYLYRPTMTKIRDKEEYWEVSLPEELKYFLMEYNGGIPKQKLFVCDGRERMVQQFLCINESSQDEYAAYGIGVVLTQIEDRICYDEDRPGYELIPIAELFGGDYVCLDYHDNEQIPSVCVWSHEESDDCDPVVYKVADSYEDFIDMLYAEQ